MLYCPRRSRLGRALRIVTGHMRARSRPRRTRRGRALRICERDTCVPAHVPAVAGGVAILAQRAGHMRARSRPRRSRRGRALRICERETCEPAGANLVHSERDTGVPAHAPAVDGGDALCA